MKKWLSLIGLLLIASAAWAQMPLGGITVASSSGGGGSTVAFLNTNTPFQVSAATYSGSATINTGGTNVVAFFPVCYDTGGGLSISAISFNSISILANVAGTPINDGASVFCTAFYYINPPTGSHTLAITCSGGCSEIYGNVVAFQGVNQTSPIRSGTYQTCSQAAGSCGDSTTTPSMTVTSNSNDLTLSCIEDDDGGSISGTNQTSDGISLAGANSFGSDHATTAASSVTHTWTLQQAFYAFLGFSIQHA